jgi:AraC-like DNA-binding protein
VHYHCHGGLEEAIKPLYFEEALLGFIMIGQVRVESEAPPGKLSRWSDRYGSGELAESFSAVPFFTRKQFSHLLSLFSSLVDLILAKHMISIRGRTRLDPLIDRMRETCSMQLSLPEAAAFLGNSSYHLAHLLKKYYGKTFKQLQTEICLQRADELFSQIPGITVKEVSGRCGFTDPLYFSRVYHKHRGHPPSTLHALRPSAG